MFRDLWDLHLIACFPCDTGGHLVNVGDVNRGPKVWKWEREMTEDA